MAQGQTARSYFTQMFNSIAAEYIADLIEDAVSRDYVGERYGWMNECDIGRIIEAMNREARKARKRSGTENQDQANPDHVVVMERIYRQREEF